MTRSIGTWALAASLMLAACGKDSSGPSGPRNDKVAGHWQYVSGPMVVGAAVDNLSYPELTASGAGTLYTNSPKGHGINGCGAISFAALSDTIVAFNIPDFPDDRGVVTQFYQYALPNADGLTLTDSLGNVTTYKRATQIPASVTCQPVPVATPIAIPDALRPNYQGLATDATNLWFSPNNGGAVPLNPTNGTTGGQITFPVAGQYQFVIAVQGTDFWLMCWCGNNTSLQRRKLNGTLVSSFDLSAAPINRQFFIRAASHDGANLWVAGYDYNLKKYQLLKLNAEVSPPTVLQAINFDAPVDGLAFKGGDPWVLSYYVGPVLVDLNTAGVAKTTNALPRGSYYRGLVTVGNTFYAVRFNSSNADILPIPGL